MCRIVLTTGTLIDRRANAIEDSNIIMKTTCIKLATLIEKAFIPMLLIGDPLIIVDDQSYFIYSNEIYEPIMSWNLKVRQVDMSEQQVPVLGWE